MDSREREYLLRSMVNSFINDRDKIPDEAPSFRKAPHFGWVDEVMERLVSAFLAIPRGLADIPEDRKTREIEKYYLSHRAIILEVVKQIEQKSRYRLFLDFLTAIEQRFNRPFPLNFQLYLKELKEERPTLPSFLLMELITIWACLEKDGRYLVCVRERHQRAPFSLPANLEDKLTALLNIGEEILVLLPFVTPQDIDFLIPKRLGALSGVDSTPIATPIIEQTVEEILTDAHSRQRYIVNPEGAIVQWKKKAGDLREIFVKEIEEVVIARVFSSQGETIAILDLKTAQGVDFLKAREGTILKKEHPLVLNLASVYHKLVTAKVRFEKEMKLGFRTAKEVGEKPVLTKEGPATIYIPRTITVGGEIRETPSPQLLISRYSPIPHPRRLKPGCLMTESQKRAVEKYAREKGRPEILRIIEILGAGHTYVLPQGQTRKVIHLAATVVPQLSKLKVN